MGNKGMLRRPWTLIVMACALFMVAVSFPLQVMLLYGHGPGEMPAVLHKLTALNWLALGGCIVTGLLIFRGSIFARMAVPPLIAVVAVNNFFVGYFATDFSFVTATVATFAFAGLLMPFYMGEVRELFLHPERQWWRSKIRVRMSVPIYVGGEDALLIKGQTHDISETGAFLPVEGTGLNINGKVSIRLSLGDSRQIRCEARVVRQTSAKGSYPAGVGLQFINLDREQRRDLRVYIARHN